MEGMREEEGRLRSGRVVERASVSDCSVRTSERMCESRDWLSEEEEAVMVILDTCGILYFGV